MREVVHYIMATTSDRYAEEVAVKFLDGCANTDYEFLPYVQSWTLELLILKMSTPMEVKIGELCEKYKPSLGQRSYALLARVKGYNDWVREQKETWLNNSPWDRRAIIWSAKALSKDEMNFWLKRVQNAGDILDKAIAESVLNTENVK